MRKRRIAAFLVATAIGVAGCGASGGKTLSNRTLAKLVLQQGDLASSFERFAEGRPLHSELDPALGGDPTRFDRQNGWIARYRRLGAVTRPGPLTVVSSAEVFAQSSGAHDFFDAATRKAAESGAANGLGTIKAAQIGDETQVIASARPPRGSVEYVTIRWRHGRVVCTIAGSGFAGRFAWRDVELLARREERRLAAVRT